MAKKLILGEWLKDSCEVEGFSLYEAEVTVNDVETIFLYQIFRVEPIDEVVDPDLYVNNNEQFPDFKNFTWKSTLFGTDSISLIPGDPRYIIGTYRLAVFNSRVGKFRIKFYTIKVPKEVIFPFTSIFIEEEYFKCNLLYPGKSRIEIKINSAPAAVFLSFTFPRPNQDQHSYSQGYLKSSNDIHDLDPFPEFPLSFVHFTSQGLDRHSESGPLRLCVDTESKYSAVYFTILPLLQSQSLEITFQEVSQESFIPGPLQPLYSHYSSFFNTLDTNLLSLNDRKSHSLEYSLEFTYGEIDFFSYVQLLQLVKPKDNEVLWDLGAGAGKSVLAAGLVYPNLKIVGVEYLPQLCQTCKEVTQGLNNIEIIQGDIKDQDWSSADIIYMSSLCFLDELLNFIIRKSRNCKPGTRVLTLREFPKCDEWRLDHSVRTLMSWGRSNCFIYTRQASPN